MNIKDIKMYTIWELLKNFRGIKRYDYPALVKKLRDKLIISQEELAKLLEVSFATINRWANGHTEPTIKAKRKLFELCKENGIEVE